MYIQSEIVRVSASSDKCTCSNGMSVIVVAE
ncbi:Lipoprotein [Corallococcus exiguus]